jgi:hypothetical protein
MGLLSPFHGWRFLFTAYPTLKRGATCCALSESESQKAESELRFNLLAFLNLLE